MVSAQGVRHRMPLKGYKNPQISIHTSLLIEYGMFESGRASVRM